MAPMGARYTRSISFFPPIEYSYTVAVNILKYVKMAQENSG